MRIYIANSRSSAALSCTTAINLRNDGHTVVNPSETDPERRGQIDAKRADIRKLCGCDCLLLLPGWVTSEFARIEYFVAVQLGLKIWTEMPIQERVA